MSEKLEVQKLRKELGIDDYLELVKEDRNCNGAYVSFGQYMYLLEQENRKYKEVFDKLKKLIEEKQEIQSEEAGFYDVLTSYITIDVDELLEILEEVK